MTSHGQAVAVVLRMFEALSAGDAEALRDTLTDDFRYRSWSVDEFIDIEFAYFGAFPDLHYVVDEIFAAGDRVTSRWRFQGTHDGDAGPGLIAGVRPTGTPVDIEGIAIARIESGHIAEWWGQWNSLALYQSLGIAPTPS